MYPEDRSSGKERTVEIQVLLPALLKLTVAFLITIPGGYLIHKLIELVREHDEKEIKDILGTPYIDQKENADRPVSSKMPDLDN